MRIPTEIFDANHGANLFLDHDGNDEHQWMFNGRRIAVAVFSNDETEAFINVFIDDKDDEDGDGSGPQYIEGLSDEEFERACVLALTGETASAEMVLMINELVATVAA